MRQIPTGQDQHLAPHFFDEWWSEYLDYAKTHLRDRPPVHSILERRCGVVLWAPRIPAFNLTRMTWFRKIVMRGANNNAGRYYDGEDDRPRYFER